MIKFKRSEFEKGLSFDNEDGLKDYLFEDYKRSWSGNAPFGKEDIVIKGTDNAHKKEVGLSRFHSTKYTEPHWIGFCVVE